MYMVSKVTNGLSNFLHFVLEPIDKGPLLNEREVTNTLRVQSYTCIGLCVGFIRIRATITRGRSHKTMVLNSNSYWSKN